MGGEGPSLGQPVLHAQLFLEGPQLAQTDVAAPTDNDHEGGQRGPELALSLQLLNHAAVHGGQGCPTGRLHQDLLVICGGGVMSVGPGCRGTVGPLGRPEGCEPLGSRPWPQTQVPGQTYPHYPSLTSQVLIHG